MRLNLRTTAAAATAALCSIVMGSTVASAATDEPIEAGITVPQVENLPDDFMNGVDASSILSLEESGVTFKDFAGNEADVFDVMADAGINYSRIRVWNDPFTAEGEGYGGGNVDAERAAVMGKRATDAGMRVFVDFHYADFWAHPGQQPVPKAWVGMTAAEKADALYDYTAETLQYMVDQGVDVGMVQIGNETTNLQLTGENWPASGALFKAGADAVRDTLGEDAKIAIHFTNPERGTYMGYADKLAKGPDNVLGTGDEIDYDVFASSYYAFWHGTLENLTTQLSNVATAYDKEVIVAETSWNYTLEDGDGHTNTIRSTTASDKYSSSVQGQALAVRDVIDATVNVGEAGIGVFYWEPAWLPVGPPEELDNNKLLWEEFGSGWASSYAGEYDPDDAGVWFGGSAWDNQAMFDFEGNPLESLRVFDYARTGTVAPREVDAIQSPSITVVDGEAIELPASVTVSYTDGTSEDETVTWGAKVEWITGPGTYEVPGTTSGGHATTATVTVLASAGEGANLVVNGGFEDGAAPWTGSGTGYTLSSSSTSDVYEGSRTAHFYSGADFQFTIQQEITDVPAGTYRLTAVAHGESGDGDTAYITAASGIASVSDDVLLEGWQAYHTSRTDLLSVVEGATVTVSATFDLSGGSWGAIDAFELVAETPVVEADTTALEGLLDDAAALDRDAWSAVTLLAVDRAVARAEFIMDASAPSQASVDAAADSLEQAIDALAPGDGTIPDPTVAPVELTVVEGDEITLPGTVDVVAYDDSTVSEEVVWSGAQDWISGPGVYTVTGITEGGWLATATITVTARGLVNPGFQTGDTTGWDLPSDPHPETYGVVADQWSSVGGQAFNVWGPTPYEYVLSQTLEGLAPGTYAVSAGGHGEDTATDAVALTGELFATSGDAEETDAFAFTGWGAWDYPTVSVTVGDSGTLTVGVRGAGGTEDYAWYDEFTLERTDAVAADTAALEDALAAASGVDRDLFTVPSLAVLDLAVEIGGIALSADTPDQDAVDEATAIVTGAIDALVAVPDLADITPDSTEFFTEISWLAREGITTGWANGDGTFDFRPLSPITRDAMAAFLYRFAGEPEVELPAESPFVDVTPTSTEFYTEIVWMYQEGLSTGWETAAGREYRPLSHVKRDAMAAFLYRFAGSPAWEDPAQSPFVDVTPDSTEFFTEITWLADTGITTGWETPAGDEYRALAHVKRDAMAAFLYRFAGM
ncbi:hypothetical protein Lsed01_01549 [Demequina sediminis]|uniref:Arabinogalactan endo-beta-1,4-galactanase n=1 Tax=Demequina sediminis TaxID=1930058 RepID=A0ABP9WH09_9MICO